MILPSDYVILKFNTYCGGVKFNKLNQTYQGSCPICREGTSWLKKKRCYYIVKDELIFCHNCGWSSKPFKWIQEVSGDTFSEIKAEAEEFDLVPFQVQSSNKDEIKKTPTLPYDSINLFDNTQISHYKNNVIIQKALDIINNRRIITAINRPKSLWLSLKDNIHKNRIIIPFYDEKNSIIFYQSRTILDSDNYLPRYLSKKNSDKSLYGVDSINTNENTIFICEGPINAFFVKNGVAVGGIQENSDKNLTPLQESQLNKFNLLEHVWVLDSQWIDSASLKKTQKLIEQNKRVFIWPEALGKQFKDFNDLAIYTKKDEIGSNFILENTFTGLTARAKLLTIRRN